jgi:hypothetical protein
MNSTGQGYTLECYTKPHVLGVGLEVQRTLGTSVQCAAVYGDRVYFLEEGCLKICDVAEDLGVMFVDLAPDTVYDGCRIAVFRSKIALLTHYSSGGGDMHTLLQILTLEDEGGGKTRVVGDPRRQVSLGTRRVRTLCFSGDGGRVILALHRNLLAFSVRDGQPFEPRDYFEPTAAVGLDDAPYGMLWDFVPCDNGVLFCVGDDVPKLRFHTRRDVFQELATPRLRTGSRIAVVPAVSGIIATDFRVGGVQVFASPDVIVQEQRMSAMRVAWMGVAARGRVLYALRRSPQVVEVLDDVEDIEDGELDG